MTQILDRWLQRLMWVPNLVILLAIVIIATYAADRATPFKMLEVPPITAKRGQTVVLTASVWRDPERRCSAEFSRFIFDAFGVRYDLGNASASADMVRDMEKQFPGKLILSVDIPDTMAIGPARLVTALQYSCNRVHTLWPIEVTTTMPFTVVQ